jgi:transcriptional regulator with XRE-family HTH domain
MPTTDIDKRLGATIRKYRVIAGLSQQQLGDPLGVTFQQVQKHERGINRVSVAALVIYAKTLGTTPGQLIDEASSAAPEKLERPSFLKLNAMRGLSRMPEKSQRIALDVINALAGDEAA